MLKYDSIAELVNEAEKRGLKLSELVLKTQAAMTEKTEEEMFATMERSLQVMKESVQDGLDKDKRSASGLTGGDAYKLNEALKAGKNIAGHFFGNAMMKAVADKRLHGQNRSIPDSGQLRYSSFCTADIAGGKKYFG